MHAQNSRVGNSAYPSIGLGQGKPFDLPLAPQVAQLVSLSPEAAPELVVAASGYPTTPARSSGSNFRKVEPRVPCAAKQDNVPSNPVPAVRPPRPKKVEPGDSTRDKLNPPSIDSSPTPNRAGTFGRPLRPAAVVSETCTKPSRPRGSEERRRCGSRGLRSKEGRKASSSPAPRRAVHDRGEESPNVLSDTIVLEGLESGSSLSDVTQLLYRHKGLQSLQLPGTVDFSELLSLRVLSLSHNALSDIRPVADLPALVDLNVNYNQIKDISPAFQCESLEVLLATNNCISSLEGMELHHLQHLSLFRNLLSDAAAVVDALSSLPQLRRLDIGGNPCADDDSHGYSFVRSLSQLTHLDGEAVGNVERALADEFFMCARDLGFIERPSSANLRPKTAPSLSGAASRKRRQARPSPSPSRSPSARKSGSRSPSASRGLSSRPFELPGEEPSSPKGSVADIVRQQTSQVEAMRLQIQTVQVDCENLRRQIAELGNREPTLGLGALRERKADLEEENQLMHSCMDKNRHLREVLAQKESELAAKREERGLTQERPRTSRPRSSCGITSAAGVADAILEMSDRLRSGPMAASSVPEGFTEADLRFKNHLLRRELERTKREASQMSNDTCVALLGQSPVAVSSSDSLPRRPCTAAPRLHEGCGQPEQQPGVQSDLLDLLRINEQSLQQITGSLRKTEQALGLQRPMTTGHLQRQSQESRPYASATLD